MKLHLGCGRQLWPGWVNVDRVALVDGVQVCDLDTPAGTPHETAVNTIAQQLGTVTGGEPVERVVAVDFIEHIHNPLALMEVLHQTAEPGTLCTFSLPYGSSNDAWEDPTHVRPYYAQSWGYFGQPNYWRSDYGYRGDWRVEELAIVFHERARSLVDSHGAEHVIWHIPNSVTKQIVRLTAVKPVRAPDRALQEHVTIRTVFEEDTARGDSG